MVSVDFSDSTDMVVDNAAIFATDPKSEIIILHVCLPLEKLIGRTLASQHIDNTGLSTMVDLSSTRYDIARDEVAHELRYEHKLILHQVDRMKEKGIKTRGILTHGKLLKTIIREVEELKIDVVVVGSHCHNTLHKLFSGSIRDSLLKQLTIPVYIVPVLHEKHHRQFKAWGA